MIIQCEKCKTRFRLDDSRVTDKGVKVRCAKCKHVFRVQKEGLEADSFELGGALTGFPSPAAWGEEPAVAPVHQDFAADIVSDYPYGSEALEDSFFLGEPANFSPLETAPNDASDISFESDDLHIAGTEKVTGTAVETASRSEFVDFSSFDFGDSEPDSTSDLSVDDFSGSTAEPVSRVAGKEAPQGLDFSDDDIFGAVAQTAPETTSKTISFDFEDDSFAESMNMGGQDSSSKSGTLFSLDAPSDAPFNLGEIDFGDEFASVAVQQVNPDDLKPSQEILFAPLAKAQDKSADDEITRLFLGEESTAARQELPPLSIASRRKRNPLFGALITLIAVLIISVLGYFGYSSFSTHIETASPEVGKISVRAVKAAFVKNDKVGEMLVISGEALNEYPTPRAALQVKVTVFDAAGQSIATKSAYGGNPMTEEQLKSMPLDKIEAAMANQFGDSLANMEVTPGKAIPFVAVLSNLPKGAKDFGVESAGSTVATGKQQ